MGLGGLRARATQRAIDAGGEGLSGESVRTVSTFRGAAGDGGGLLHFVVVRIFGEVFSCEDEHAREFDVVPVLRRSVVAGVRDDSLHLRAMQWPECPGTG